MNSAAKAMVIAAATTDGKGEVMLPVPGDRPLALRLPGPGHVPMVVAAEFPTAGALVVTVRTGARLQGHIASELAFAEIKRLAGIGAGANDARTLWPSIQLWRSGAAAREYFPEVSQRHSVKPDGSFDLTGIPPGRWRIVVMCPQRNPGDHGRSFREEDGGFVDLVDDETANVAIDLTALLPGQLEGVALHNGSPLVDTLVQLRMPLKDHPDGEPFFYVSATTDRDGRFRASLRGGEYQLLWYPSMMQGEMLGAVERARIEVGKTTRQTFTQQSGQLDVLVLDDAGKPVADVAIEMRDAAGAQRFSLSPTDAAGRASVVCAAGPLTAWVLPKRLQSQQAQNEFLRARPGQRDPFVDVRLPLGAVEVRLGATTKVELKLPPAWGR